MDLLLTHGYFLAYDREEQRIMRPHPPLGILYLASYLKERGVDVGVFDSTFQRFEDFEEELHRTRPPVVGIAVNLMTKRNALRMMRAARAASARVVVGGPDPPFYADEYLRSGADAVVIGEGEQTLLELLPRLLAGGPPRPERGTVDHGAGTSSILPARHAAPVGSLSAETVCRRAGDRLDLSGVAGLAWAGGRTAPRALLPQLDALPFPDRAAIDLDRYLAAWRTRHGHAAVSLITARGCPYTCTWCSRSVFGSTHRRRSPANVADEVEAIADRYRPERLWYADDVFAIHRGWTLAFAAEMQRRRLRVPFECISRAERIDDEVADALVDLGCWRVWIGAESGSQRVLDAMQRRVRIEQVVDATRRLRRRGIQVGMFIMLGYAGEHREDLEATIHHLRNAAPDVFLTTVAYPIKGTPYYDLVERHLIATAPWDERTDRDWVVSNRPPRRYYEFARRWITAEVARHRHWHQGRYARALRAAGSSLIGRIGMALTGGAA